MTFKKETKFTKKTNEIIQSLKLEKEINKIVVFGSFLVSKNPHDIDVAIFQDSKESYLSLAMKYRRLTREISKSIPIDIIPIKSNASNNSFLSEIEAGELIYER
jgi:predicted nucleotidyltransferase